MLNKMIFRYEQSMACYNVDYGAQNHRTKIGFDKFSFFIYFNLLLILPLLTIKVYGAAIHDSA